MKKFTAASNMNMMMEMYMCCMCMVSCASFSDMISISDATCCTA